MPAQRQLLAEAIGRLQTLTGQSSQVGVVRLLNEHGLGITKSDFSRYRNGKRVPAESFMRAMHKLACAVSGADTVQSAMGMGREDLLHLRESAERRRCHSCLVTTEENLRLTEENRQLRLRLNASGQTPEDGTQAGSAGAAPRGAVQSPAKNTPPVPRADTDRRELRPQDFAAASSGGRSRDDDAALQLVRQAEIRLGLGKDGRAGEESALALLLDTATSLTDDELRLAVTLLRSNSRDALAESVLEVYGRERDAHDVIETAITLQRAGQAGDSLSLLRASARRQRILRRADDSA